MRRPASLATALLVPVLALTAFAPAGPPEPLTLGSTAPGQTLRLNDTRGTARTLASLKGRRGLVVIFSANTCPYVLAWQNRYDDIAMDARRLGYGTVIVNSNEQQRGGADSPAAMRTLATAQRYAMPYVVDTGHRLADSFGATRTPEVFLFDAGMKLVYHGAIDDNANDESAVTARYLHDAMEANAAGRAIAMPTTRFFGCSIKRNA